MNDEKEVARFVDAMVLGQIADLEFERAQRRFKFKLAPGESPLHAVETAKIGKTKRQ